MTRCLNALALSIALFPFTTSAGTIEVAQWIPWEFAAKEIFNQPLSIAVQESELEMNFSELTPRLMGVNIKVKGELKNLSFSSSGISADQTFSAEISVNKIRIDQLITRDFNGNQIQIHLKADCSPLTISVPVINSAVESTFVKEAARWQPELSALSLSIPDNSWNLSSFTCSGIGGVGEEIAATITSALKNPQSFAPMIKEMIGSEMGKVISEGWMTLLQSTGSELTITGMEKPSDKGFLVYASLDIKNNRNVSLPKPDDSKLSATNPQLVFSSAGFEALLEDKFMQMAPQKFNLQTVPAFSSLMKSRTKQYFAWPDLRRFPSDTPFLLSTFTHQSQLRLKPAANGKWHANLNANGVLETLIGGSPIDYIQFGIGVATEMSIKVVDGKLLMASGVSQLELAWSYGFLYQLIYRPNTRIAIDIFKSSLNQFFTNQKVEETLPSLNFQNHDWKLQNWKQQNDIITMDWL